MNEWETWRRQQEARLRERLPAKKRAVHFPSAFRQNEMSECGIALTGIDAPAWSFDESQVTCKRCSKSMGKPPKPDVVTRPITDDERYKLKNLKCVRPAWWCGDSRFIKQFEVVTEHTQITERQAFFIRVLWYKYRKQLGHDGPKPEGYA